MGCLFLFAALDNRTVFIFRRAMIPDILITIMKIEKMIMTDGMGRSSKRKGL